MLVVWDLSRIGVLWHPKKTVAGKCRAFASFKLLLMYLLIVYVFVNSKLFSSMMWPFQNRKNLEFAPT